MMSKDKFKLRYKIVKDCDEGSTLVPNEIYDLDGLEVFHITLYCFLVSKIDKSDMAKVSLKQIVSVNVSKRKAIDTLRELEQMGLISKVTRTGEDGSNLSNAYVIYHPSILSVG